MGDKTNHLIIMGNAPLTVQQQDNIRSGRAVYVDGYHEFPNGAAAKTIWALPKKWGLSKGDTWFEDAVAIDAPNVAVTSMMEQLGATLLYEEFMAAVYDAPKNVKESIEWSYLLWGGQKAHDEALLEAM